MSSSVLVWCCLHKRSPCCTLSPTRLCLSREAFHVLCVLYPCLTAKALNSCFTCSQNVLISPLRLPFGMPPSRCTISRNCLSSSFNCLFLSVPHELRMSSRPAPHCV